MPVHVATDLTPAQVKAYRIADNQTATLAEWDYDLLPLELADLQGMDFDLDLLGFDADELAKLLSPTLNDGPDRSRRRARAARRGDHAARRPVAPRRPPPAVRRQQQARGRGSAARRRPHPPGQHRPALQREGRAAQSNNAIAAGLSSFTAPRTTRRSTWPGIPSKSKPTGKKLRAKDRPLANDFVSRRGVRPAAARLVRQHRPRAASRAAAFYIWGGYANCGNYPPVLKARGLYFSQAIIWDKQHPVLTRKDFMGAHEWCQPPDTQVLTPAAHRRLSELRDGDRVVSFYAHTPPWSGFATAWRSRLPAATVRGQALRRDGRDTAVVVHRRPSLDGPPYAATTAQVVRLPDAARGHGGASASPRCGRPGASDSKAVCAASVATRAGSSACTIRTRTPASHEQLVSVQFGIPQTCWKESPAWPTAAALAHRGLVRPP